MSLDKDTVTNIAFLARIRVKDENKEHLAGELSQILDWVEQLAEVDTDGVAPMASVADITQPMRADVVTGGNIPQKVLSNAPDTAHGFFKVPKVVE